ncbi:MAG: hypothetical protein HC916_01320, partial [Coleofasciculaceae cyanobacterium SM2_1_6]|nr:hypothetical protein [Coleofasciculaceae cyanobacterium SM2_1_6]
MSDERSSIVSLGIVIGFNLGLSLLLLWLAGWFWQWRGSLQTSERELSIATQKTQEFSSKNCPPVSRATPIPPENSLSVSTNPE